MKIPELEFKILKDIPSLPEDSVGWEVVGEVLCNGVFIAEITSCISYNSIGVWERVFGLDSSLIYGDECWVRLNSIELLKEYCVTNFARFYKYFSPIFKENLDGYHNRRTENPV